MEITISHPPPSIEHYYDIFMFDPLAGMIHNIKARIVPISDKKIRIQDTGKRKEFDRLLQQCRKTYERKKVEEAEYKEKIEKAEKRPSIPNSSSTIRFRRMESKK